MRNFWLILSVLWLWTCSGGGDKATGPEEPPIVINLTSLGGQAQKGPFNNGTAINVAELTNTLSPTGRNFSSAITDNTGRFAVANVQLESPYVELRANGYYFNEVSNEISSGQLTLFALSNLTGKTSLNVNILTHLEKNRMIALMSGDNPKTFAQAKLQAQEEVFAIFDYSRANVPESELLDISQSGAANAKLLAISAIVQGDLAVGQMSQLLANISTDIASDGTLDDTNLRDILISNTQGLDMSQVRSNLETHYSSLGISATIPDFESEINQFLKPPVVQDIDLSVEEDNAINITLSGSDPEGESITFSIVDDTDNATLTLNGNVVNYTPNAHFNGTDTFTYKANDGTSDSNTGTVTITVNAVDDEPNTIDVTATTDEDNAVDVSLSAEEYDGDSYSFAIITDVSNGTTSLNGSTVTYTPNQDFNGEDSFTFEATDDTGRTINVATATITVNPVNDAPVANDITNQVTDENRMMQLDITLDATDVEGDALIFNVASTNNGSVTINDNIATYVPNQDWNGEDTFTYTANDGSLDSNTATVTITVNAVNDIPIVYDASVSGDEDATSSVGGSSINGFKFILPEATDIESGSSDDFHNSLEIVTLPTHGKIYSNNNEGDDSPENELSVGSAMNNIEDGYGARIWYVQDTEHWNGTDTFTYKANDGEADSNIATVTITVNSINDAPVAEDKSISLDEDWQGDGTQYYPMKLIVSDVDNTGLTFSVVNNPLNGDLGNGFYTNAGNGANADSIAYKPNANWNGTDTFTYKANDGELDSNISTVTIIVNPVNDAPIAYDFSKTVDKNSEITFALRETSPGSNTGTDNEGGVYDPDIETGQDDNITFTLMSQPSNGTAELISNNDIKYTPNTGFVGTDTFTFRGNDGELDSNTATITINVSGVDITYPTKDMHYFTPGQDYVITWDGYLDDVSIALFKDGSKILDIAENLGSVNSYNWTVPSDLTFSDDYKVKIYPADDINSSVADMSENNFTINPVINVVMTANTDDFDAYNLLEKDDGGFYLGGTTYGNEASDNYLAEYDSFGNQLFSNSWGNTNYNKSDYIQNIRFDLSGDIIGTGYTTNNSDYREIYWFKASASSGQVLAEGSYAWNGHLLYNDVGHDIVDTGNGFLVAAHLDTFGMRQDDAGILVLDSDMNLQQVIEVKGSNDSYEDSQYNTRILPLSDGNYLNLIRESPSGGQYWGNILMVKVDSQGQEIWRNSIQTSYKYLTNFWSSFKELQDGNFLTTLDFADNDHRKAAIITIDSFGNQIDFKVLSNQTEDLMPLNVHLRDVILSNDGGYYAIGYNQTRDEQDIFEYSPWLIKLNNSLEIESQAIFDNRIVKSPLPLIKYEGENLIFYGTNDWSSSEKYIKRIEIQL